MLEEKDLQAFAKLLEPIKDDITKIKGDFTEVKQGLTEVKRDVIEVKKDVVEVKKDVVEVKKDVGEVQLTLENETNKKINIVAEGHLDLTRKLDDALKVENEKEMLLLRVTSLENELRRIKKRIEEIA